MAQKPPHRLNSEKARALRRDAVNFARGSVRLEGFVLSPEAEAIFQRYIVGLLSEDRLTPAIKEIAGVVD